MVAVAPAVQVFEHREGVRADRWQERVRGAVEQLQWCHVRLKVAMPGQRLDGFGVRHERLRLPLVP